jgi:hypothetical protein
MHSPGAWEQTRQAVKDWLCQTQPRARLLLAVEPETDGEERDKLTRVCSLANVRQIELTAPPPQRLAEALYATGAPLICWWSSAIRHHSQRIQAQVAALGDLRTVACFMSGRLFFDSERGIADSVQLPQASQGFFDTLLFYRQTGRFQAEDLAQLFLELTRAGRVQALANSAHLTLALRRGAPAQLHTWDTTVRRYRSATPSPHVAEALRDYELV